MLNYLNLKEFMVGLGLISEIGANTDSNERVLLYDFWRCLDGEEKEEVHSEDIRVLVLAVLRMCDGHKRIGVSERPD